MIIICRVTMPTDRNKWMDSVIIPEPFQGVESQHGPENWQQSSQKGLTFDRKGGKNCESNNPVVKVALIPNTFSATYSLQVLYLQWIPNWVLQKFMLNWQRLFFLTYKTTGSLRNDWLSGSIPYPLWTGGGGEGVMLMICWYRNHS